MDYYYYWGSYYYCCYYYCYKVDISVIVPPPSIGDKSSYFVYILEVVELGWFKFNYDLSDKFKVFV